jgi:hypothetical protein
MMRAVSRPRKARADTLRSNARNARRNQRQTSYDKQSYDGTANDEG